MKKIMIVNTSGLGIGGITTHMLNYVGELHEQYEFTIVATIFYDKNVIDAFKKLGCEVVLLPNRKKHVLSYLKQLKKILKNKKIDVIHVHGNSATMLLELNLAKKYGVRKRIAHCHNSLCSHPYIHKLLSNKFKMAYTDAVACSNIAGEWIYGKDNFVILPNSIDTSNYKYNEAIRNNYRKMFEVDEDTLLLGNIGNLIEQKNQIFLIPVINELIKKRKCKLIIIGSGELEKEIKEKITKYDLKKYIVQYPYRNDISNCLQAFDSFVFPSKWEGLPMVLVEAQTSGIPCICSNNVSNEVAVTPWFKQLPLNVDDWVEYLSKIPENTERDKGISFVKSAGYDIHQSSEKLMDMYNK